MLRLIYRLRSLQDASMLNAPRRRALVALGALISLRPGLALTQSIPRIAFVSTNGRADSPEPREAFLQGLREHGYAEGRTITIEWRFAERKPDRKSTRLNSSH